MSAANVVADFFYVIVSVNVGHDFCSDHQERVKRNIRSEIHVESTRRGSPRGVFAEL